jgi:hypothetical protein
VPFARVSGTTRVVSDATRTVRVARQISSWTTISLSIITSGNTSA